MRYATACFVLAAMIAAGCGGSSAPSRKEYAKSATQICQEAEKGLKGLGNSSNAQELQQQFANARRTLDDAIGKLADLDRPSGKDGDLANRWIASLKRAQTEFDSAIDDIVAALKSRDADRIKRAGDRAGRITTAESDDLGTKLGVDRCVG
jgi:hypothetical protein